MSSLFSSLGVASRSLQAQQIGLDVTQNNIANANTPGYSRQRANLSPVRPGAFGPAVAGGGVTVKSIESYRDRFLEYRINRETQSQGKYEASSAALKQIDDLLNENDSRGLQKLLSGFFNSFSSLANNPEDIALRQDVLVKAGNFVSELKDSYDRIQDIQTSQDQLLRDSVDEINSLSVSIADLNERISHAQAIHASESETLKDERQVKLDKLSKFVDVSFFPTESGAYTVTTRSGALLVTEGQSHTWSVIPASTGSFTGIKVDNVDITSTIRSGKLGGLLEVRDTKIPSYLKDLDDLAATVVSSVNAQHILGRDYNGNVGGNFFAPFTQSVPGSNTGAVRALSVTITDPKLIAAASNTGGIGSNGNASLLAGLQDQLLFSSGTATAEGFYSHLVSKIGFDAKAAEDNHSAQDHVLTQLQNQQDSISGVSLDDEAINVIRFQKAYEASARVIRVVDDLTSDLMKLLGG